VHQIDGESVHTLTEKKKYPARTYNVLKIKDTSAIASKYTSKVFLESLSFNSEYILKAHTCQ